MQVLYTGPMYKIYNVILRQHPEKEYESFESNGNLFSTTLHALISAVSKIAQVQPGVRLAPARTNPSPELETF